MSMAEKKEEPFKGYYLHQEPRIPKDLFKKKSGVVQYPDGSVSLTIIDENMIKLEKEGKLKILKVDENVK
jgi:hypothetical protein